MQRHSILLMSSCTAAKRLSTFVDSHLLVDGLFLKEVESLADEFNRGSRSSFWTHFVGPKRSPANQPAGDGYPAISGYRDPEPTGATAVPGFQSQPILRCS
jgi:hypothetical protein